MAPRRTALGTQRKAALPDTDVVSDLAREIRARIEPARLRQHVERLAEPRSHRHAPDGIARAEAYVTGQLDAAGWAVTRRPFAVAGTVAVNLVARRRDRAGGSGPAYLVGAHLDTVPGGVACLLELARVLRSAERPQTVLGPGGTGRPDHRHREFP